MNAILTYHAINDPWAPAVCHADPTYSLPVELFKSHLVSIARSGVPVVPLRDLIDASTSAGPRVALTFDDGHPADQATTWPLLRDSGLPATFFICLCNIGGVGDPRWAMIRRMREEGHSFGAHGVRHIRYDRLKPAEQRDEMQRSRSTIEQHLGAPVDLFAFPFGKFDRSALRVARELGFRAVFTTVGPYPPNTEEPFVLHRWSMSTSMRPERIETVLREDLRERVLATVAGPFRKWFAGPC